MQNWVCWAPLILALGKQRQADLSSKPAWSPEFQDIQGYTEEPCFDSLEVGAARSGFKTKMRQTHPLEIKRKRFSHQVERWIKKVSHF